MPDVGRVVASTAGMTPAEAVGIKRKIEHRDSLTPREVAAYEAVTGDKVPPELIIGTVENLKQAYDRSAKELRDAEGTAGSKGVAAATAKMDAARKALMAKATEEYRASATPDRVKYLGGILGYSEADVARRLGLPAPSPYAKPPIKVDHSTPAGAVPIPPPVGGGVAPGGGVAASAPPIGLPGTGAKLQPAIGFTPPPAMRSGVQGDVTAGGISPATSAAFWKWMQEKQKAGKLVSDYPMYTKPWDEATPEERARLMTANADYYKEFVKEFGEKRVGPGAEKQAATPARLPSKPMQTAKIGGAASGGGKAAKIAEAAASSGDPMAFLTRLGEVLQAGAYGMAGGSDLAGTAYGMRVAREAEAAKAAKENDFYERMKQLDLEYQKSAAEKAEALERWKTGESSGLTREGWAAEKAKSDAALAESRYEAELAAKAREAATGSSGLAALGAYLKGAE